MPKQKPTRKRRLMTWLFIILGLYIAYCGLLYFLQTGLIFPAGLAGQPGDGPSSATTKVIELKTDEGTTTAWFTPGPTASEDDPAPLAVFFHGNAELIDYQEAIHRLYYDMGFSVLMVEYRGYGHSDGTPSEPNIVADATAVLVDVLDREDVDTDRLVLHGRSVGGMLASQVALQCDPAALIVESTGTSVADMAKRFAIPPFILRSPLRTREAFEQLDCPILIMHGRDDEIFSLDHARALEAAGKDTTLVIFNASHNTLPNGEEVRLYERSVEAHLSDAGVLQE